MNANNIAVIEAFAVNLQNWLTEICYSHDYKVDIEYGKKNARIVTSSRLRDSDHDFNSRAAYGFIDIETLDVLKAASWKAPAKGVRGNLLTSKNLFGGVCQQYSIAYLRG